MVALRMAAVTLLAGACLAPRPASAQADTSRSPSFYVGGGVSEFDLAGTGTAPLLAVRASWNWRRHFVIETGTSIGRLDENPGKTTLLIPDAQLQAQLAIGNWRPYLGVGGGVAIGGRTGVAGATRVDPAVSTAAGVRLWFRRWLALRGELRVHGIGDSLEGASAEWTAGLQWRFK